MTGKSASPVPRSGMGLFCLCDETPGFARAMGASLPWHGVTRGYSNAARTVRRSGLFLACPIVLEHCFPTTGIHQLQIRSNALPIPQFWRAPAATALHAD